VDRGLAVLTTNGHAKLKARPLALPFPVNNTFGSRPPSKTGAAFRHPSKKCSVSVARNSSLPSLTKSMIRSHAWMPLNQGPLTLIGDPFFNRRGFRGCPGHKIKISGYIKPPEIAIKKQLQPGTQLNRDAG